MPTSYQPLPCRKKGFRRRNFDTLPYPNFGLKDHELPTICRCTYDGDEFYVINRIDMITLYQNGVFGISNKTGRGPSRLVENERNPSAANQKSNSVGGFDEKNGADATTNNTEVRNTNTTTVVNENELEMTNGNGHCNPPSSTNANRELDESQAEVKHEETAEVIEKLILSPEEVIFLSFGVGCLSIQNINGDNLSFDDVWRICVEKNKEFPIIYAVYHYFRSKNWVPKEGAKYGGDYVLYQEGPEVNHSNFVVHILGIPSRSIPTWNGLHSWSRVAINSKKVLLLCNVTLPKDFKADNPRCIFSIKIKETLINRWKPTCSTSTE